MLGFGSSGRIGLVRIGFGLIAVSLSFAPGEGRAELATSTLSYAEQGWSAADRNTFYTTSQGSRLIPLAWFKALRRLDADEPFAADRLKRYGYIPSDNPGNTLPIGFVVDKRAPTQLGMTCAACHTNQLEYQKDGVTRTLRLDGAPALADFQQFLTDLTAAARATSSEPARFNAFAKAVLGNVTPAKSAQLKKDFDAWLKIFGDFMDRSLPESPWGPGRLDAFGMIFNRVTAKDLKIPGNFRKADAPVSYPFLWNASRQDKTQWNGGVPNGLFIHALARNTGEVFGVFADYNPTTRIPGSLFFPKVINYKDNSADFAGLQTLEEKISALQPPKWPSVFPLDNALVAKGKPLFEQHCASCHAQTKSKEPGLENVAWGTPVVAVGTDPKMVKNSAREVDPGVFTGALLPPPVKISDIGARFEDPALAVSILASSVIGAILDEAFLPLPITPAKVQQSGVWRAFAKDLGTAADQLAQRLSNPMELAQVSVRVRSLLDGLYKQPAGRDAPAAYESRVLYGIWATAPYLHNGSVPNLWELLKPASERVPSFKVGSRKFDPKNVGYATDDSPFKTGTYVTDPANANGNGNGGHEYGKDLSADDRWAIIEYLKTL